MKESVIYQDIVATAKAQALDEGEAKGRMAVALNLLNLGMELSQIAQVTGLSIETLQQLQHQAQ
jgi:predicted transposase/invertase (TIGR01784 family)